MSLSTRQFSHLTEMGISLWRSNSTPEIEVFEGEQEHNQLAQNKTVVIDFNELSQQPLFNDILRCLGLSLGEVSYEHHQLNLGLLNWQFSRDEYFDFSHNVLTTPLLPTLITSPELKRQLWQLFSQHNLQSAS